MLSYPVRVLLLVTGVVWVMAVWQRWALESPAWAYPLVVDGVAAPVVLSGDDSPERVLVAQDLARVLGLLAGSGSEHLLVDRWGRIPGIYLGDSRSARLRFPTPPFQQPLSAQGLRAGPAGVHFFGTDDGAAIAGLYTVLRRTGHVDWLDPFPEGERVWEIPGWWITAGEFFLRPAFISRNLTGFGTGEGRQWARRQGLDLRFRHGHALDAVFSPGRLRAQPELAPLFEGEPYFPERGEPARWQPNLLASPAVRIAADAVAARPPSAHWRVDARLGMNDSMRFDQRASTLAAFQPLRWRWDQPVASDYLFGFTNRVAAELRERDQRVPFTAYAYGWAVETPRFPVDPLTVPVVTLDSAQRFHPRRAGEQAQLMQDWSGTGAAVMVLYDYLYGGNHLIPRLPFTAIATAIADAHAAGFDGYTAELNPVWGFDAPKAWLVSRLLENADRDPEKTVAAYIAEAYGPAGPAMERFFAECERLWMEQPGDPRWIKYFRDEAALALFPPEVCRELGGLLGEALLEAGDHPGAADRVHRTINAFAVTSAASHWYTTRARLARAAFTGNTAEALPGLRRYAAQRGNVLSAFTRLRRENGNLRRAFAAFPGEPVIPFLLHRFERETDPAARASLIEAVAALPEVVQPLLAYGEMVAGPGNGLLRNPGLVDDEESPATPRLHWRRREAPAGWILDAQPAESLAVGRIPGGGLRIVGSMRSVLHQTIALEPGDDGLLEAGVDLAGVIGPGCMVMLEIAQLDADREVVSERKTRLYAGDYQAGGRLRTAALRDPAAGMVRFSLRVDFQESPDILDVRNASLVLRE